MKKQYISPNLQVHFLQIEGGMLCGSIDIVNNNSNVITTDENNIEGGAWTNKKGNSIWDNMRENDEYWASKTYLNLLIINVFRRERVREDALPRFLFPMPMQAKLSAGYFFFSPWKIFFSPRYFFLSAKIFFIQRFWIYITKFVIRVTKFVTHVSKFVTKKYLRENENCHSRQGKIARGKEKILPW